MGKKSEAYVDTSALIAFADRSDTYHPLFRRLFGNPPLLITTSLVIAEGHGWFLRRYDQSRALQFLSMIEEMEEAMRILPIGQTELTEATAVLRKYSDQDLTLTDASGLYLMRTRRIRSCWSTDFQLGLTGVPLVIHE
ncbi:MAG TPA: PIN domain-containing protein [Terriglobia bacterium]|nr:PIN domain-containing protein [Terriglobia bacterium]